MSVRPWDVPAYRLVTGGNTLSRAGLPVPGDADVCPDVPASTVPDATGYSG
jgi:hypothetical protein